MEWILTIAPFDIFSQGIANIKSLSTSSTFSFLTSIWKTPLGYEVIQAILPPGLLLLFLCLVPLLLHILVRLSGMRSVSEVDFMVISLFFIFQVRSGPAEKTNLPHIYVNLTSALTHTLFMDAPMLI